MELLEIGATIGDLRIERELGRGAFGCVYLAHDTLIGRDVALKVLPQIGSETLPRERERILREARVAGQLRHPNVVVLHRVHPPGALAAWLFEMEYVDGGTLAARLCAPEPLGTSEIRSIFSGVAAAMKAAAAAGIVHGDLKPGNVMLTSDGVPKLGDFGLARFLGEDSLGSSSAGGLTGTPQYAAPEIVMGRRPDPRSDLWSLGVILYRMLSGRLPFVATDITALFYAILNCDPPPPPPQAPRDLARIAMRLLSRDRSERGEPDELVLDAGSIAVAEGVDRPRRGDRKLVGRAPECERLREAIDTLRTTRKGATVAISGEPGIGKSALADWALASAGGEGIASCQARVNAIEGLVRPVFIALCAELESLSATETQQSRSAWNMARRYAGDPASTVRSDVGEPAWAMENTIRSVLQRGPVVVLIDDAHHLNEQELGIVRQVGRRLRDEGLLLLVAGRRAADERTAQDQAAPGPDFEAALASPDVDHLRLDPLDRERAYELIQGSAAGLPVAVAVARRVLEVAGGNPLFLLESLRHMRETGAVVVEQHVLVPGAAWERALVPDRLRELFELRVQGLPAEQRDLLDVAAVDGVEFSAKAVSAVLNMPELAVLRELQRLYRDRGLIAPLEAGYRFSSAMIHAILVREIAPELRRVLHARLAEYYASAAADSISAARLAEHFELGGDAARAAPLFLQAAAERAERQDPERAIRFAERGGIRAKGADSELLLGHSRLVIALAGLYNDHGRCEEAEGLVCSLRDAALARGDETLALRSGVILELVRYRSQGIDAVSSEALAEAAERLAGEVEGGRAHYVLGLIATRAGRLEEAERALHAADRVFLERDSIGLHSSALNALATIANRRGDWETAQRLYDESAEQSRHVGRLANAAISELNGGMSALRQGKLDYARHRVERAVRILELEGSALYAAHARVMLAETLVASGEFGAARVLVNQSLAVLDPGRLPLGLVAALVANARLQIALGALGDARASIDRALEFARKAGDARSLAQLELSTSRLCLVGGDAEGAFAAFGEAIRLAEATEDAIVREGLPQAILESAVFGLPSESVRRLVERLKPGDDAAHSIVQAALQWQAGSAPVLVKAAEALEQQSAGLGRWERVQLAGILRAMAAHGAESARIATDVARAAHRAGDVWLELTALRWLPDAARCGRTAEIMGGIETLGADPARMTRLNEFWSKGANR